MGRKYVGSAPSASDDLATVAEVSERVAKSAVPYDFTFVQTLTTRATGTGELPEGMRMARSGTISRIDYRLGTADGTDGTVAEIKLNGSTLTGTSSGTITGTSDTVTGSFAFSAGDILTVDITAVDSSPGERLTADITATADIS